MRTHEKACVMADEREFLIQAKNTAFIENQELDEVESNAASVGVTNILSIKENETENVYENYDSNE